MIARPGGLDQGNIILNLIYTGRRGLGSQYSLPGWLRDQFDQE